MNRIIVVIFSALMLFSAACGGGSSERGPQTFESAGTLTPMGSESSCYQIVKGKDGTLPIHYTPVGTVVEIRPKGTTITTRAFVSKALESQENIGHLRGELEVAAQSGSCVSVSRWEMGDQQSVLFVMDWR